MQYRLDQKSGQKLSALGFGCMRFPRGRTMQFDKEKTEELILSAIEQGVNYFDTAYIYGGSEVMLGSILHKHGLRDKVYIATKLPHQKCNVPEDFEKLFLEQLERLQTDHIDYYLIHNLSDAARWVTLRDLGIEKWIAEKQASGQIRQIGFSFHGEQGEFLKLLDVYDWDFVQIQYNYVNTNYQAGQLGLQKAAEKGLSVIVMEPLLGGKLASGLPKKAEALLREADERWTPAQWAFRWLYNQPEVTVVLSGMNAAEQLADNIAVADTMTAGAFTESELSIFEPVVTAFSEAFRIPCTGCNYCMPCPKKVNIPGCFAAYNISYTMGYFSGMQQYLTGTGLTDPNKGFGARNCVKCGQCEKQCPQHIEIIKSLESVSKRMEPFWLSAVMKVAMKFM